MKRVELKTKKDFENIQDWIKYGLKNNIILGKDEYDYIFNHLEEKPFNIKYDAFNRSVRFLLNNMGDERIEEVIESLNSNFRFKPRYVLAINPIRKEFVAYSYKCKSEDAKLDIVKFASCEMKKSRLAKENVL